MAVSVSTFKVCIYTCFYMYNARWIIDQLWKCVEYIIEVFLQIIHNNKVMCIKEKTTHNNYRNIDGKHETQRKTIETRSKILSLYGTDTH
jgi:hypothetical protein